MVAGTAFAGAIEEGKSAYDNGNYKKAFRIFKPLAEQGSTIPQYNLGLMYYNGRGVPQDYSKAVEWYRKAAEQGLAAAQYNLGFMYGNGEGVPLNFNNAAKWTRKAAEQLDPQALAYLGLLYNIGEGVPQNNIQAYKWFSLAAARGNHNAKALREQLAREMSFEQRKKAQNLAIEWAQKHKGEKY